MSDMFQLEDALMAFSPTVSVNPVDWAWS